MGTDETTPETDLNEVEAALENGIDVDSPEITEKLEALKRKLGVTAQSEQPEEGPQQHLGKDVDWSEYDLDPKFAHLYPQSRLDMTEDGPRWIVMITEYKAIKGPYEPTNKHPDIGRVITQMINGPEGWRLQSAVVPVNNQIGIATLQRIFPIILPQPNMLKSEESVTPPPPTEEELKAMEKEALDWVNGVGVAPEPPATPAEAENPPSLEDQIERVGNKTGDPDRPND